MNARSTRSALFLSAVSMLLCVSMLIGTTFAWFTDSVTSANNIITSGNLDVELYYQAEGQSGWTKVTEATNIFMEGALWEPGHTEVVKLKIVNEGTLALSYQMGVNILRETGSRDALGNPFLLSDYIRYGIIQGEQTYTRDQAVAAVTSDSTALNITSLWDTASLLPKTSANTDNEDIFTMVVYMPTTVGNEANYGKGENVPQIWLGLNLFATQFAYEADSFGSDYDGTALTDRVYTVPELENMYDFTYYKSLADAFGMEEDGSIIREETSVAGVYTDDNGDPCVVLLKDLKVDSRLKPSQDMTLNLGGYKLSSSDILCINVTGGNFVLDGRLPGSGIVHSGTAGTIGCLQVPASSTAESVTIIGGNYEINNTGSGAAVVLNLKNKNCVTTVTDCNFVAKTTNNKANGIVNDGTTILNNCTIRAYSNYNLENDNFTAMAYAVYSTGNLTVEDCDLFGTHSAIGSTGSLTVNAGTYSGYGHGGLYISGSGITARIRNAKLKDSVTMPEGYTSTAPHNCAGSYIGGSSGGNITVYMDGCDIYGTNYPVVLKGSQGETNTKLYISNTTINAGSSFRIDNDTHHLYIGAGNNFTAENTNRPGAVTQTTEVYR